MVMMAWREWVTTAVRAAIYPALEEGLTGGWLSKRQGRGGDGGKALESKQPSKHARDHSAG
jgi:hypothetical protein